MSDRRRIIVYVEREAVIMIGWWVHVIPRDLEVLRNIEPFEDLSKEELWSIQKLCVEHKVQKGEYIFHEGYKRESVYFIHSGLIKIFKNNEDGQEYVLDVFSQGRMFPPLGFLEYGPYPITAQALTPCVLYSIRYRQFNALLVQYPTLSSKVLQIMGDRIIQLQSKLQVMALPHSYERVLALLQQLASQHGHAEQDGIHVALPLNHGDMGRMIGMTRESVSRVWNQLLKLGVLSVPGDEWVLQMKNLASAQNNTFRYTE